MVFSDLFGNHNPWMDVQSVTTSEPTQEDAERNRPEAGKLAQLLCKRGVGWVSGVVFLFLLMQWCCTIVQIRAGALLQTVEHDDLLCNPVGSSGILVLRLAHSWR